MNQWPLLMSTRKGSRPSRRCAALRLPLDFSISMAHRSRSSRPQPYWDVDTWANSLFKLPDGRRYAEFLTSLSARTTCTWTGWVGFRRTLFTITKDQVSPSPRPAALRLQMIIPAGIAKLDRGKCALRHRQHQAVNNQFYLDRQA